MPEVMHERCTSAAVRVPGCAGVPRVAQTGVEPMVERGGCGVESGTERELGGTRAEGSRPRFRCWMKGGGNGGSPHEIGRGNPDCFGNAEGVAKGEHASTRVNGVLNGYAGGIHDAPEGGGVKPLEGSVCNGLGSHTCVVEPKFGKMKIRVRLRIPRIFIFVENFEAGLALSLAGPGIGVVGRGAPRPRAAAARDASSGRRGSARRSDGMGAHSTGIQHWPCEDPPRVGWFSPRKMSPYSTWTSGSAWPSSARSVQLIWAAQAAEPPGSPRQATDTAEAPPHMSNSTNKSQRAHLALLRQPQTASLAYF
eukprot:gene12030-biopygen11567